MLKKCMCLIFIVIAIFVINYGQVTAVIVTQLTTDANSDFSPDWSPLGDKIVFTSDRTGPFRIWVVPSTGGTPTKLSELSDYGDEEPKWSPDANYILFQSREGPWYLYTMTSTGDSVTQRTDFNSNNPDWSPDGLRIVWGYLYIKVRDLEGGTPMTLTYGEFPSWSPDTGWIAYMYQDDIYIISASGDSIVYQLTTDPAHDMIPDWSPDGAWIAFTSNRSGNRDIWVMDSRGESYGLWQITTSSADDYWPSWSPDGTKIVFSSDNTGNRDIWIASDLGIPGTGPGWISGVIKDAQTANPLQKATVRTTSMPYGGDQTDESGDYSAKLPAGTYQIEVSAPGYQTQNTQVVVEPEEIYFADFDLTPNLPKMRYRGANPISGKSAAVVNELDNRITCGDHVHLELPFENVGGPATSFILLFDNAVPEFGMPDVWFSLDGETGNWHPYLMVDLGDINAGEAFTTSFWAYIENLDYEERDVPEGRDQTIYVFYDEAHWPPDVIIEIDLEPVDFSNLARPGEQKFLYSDCLCNPKGTKISQYAQYAAGESRVESFDPEPPIIDPDIPGQAAFNVKTKINSEFTFDFLAGMSQGRLWDEVLVARRNKDGSTGLKLGVCRDFADLQNSILRSLGLPSRRVTGFFPPVCEDCLPYIMCFPPPPLPPLVNGYGPVGHSWNEVFMHGGWYYIDAT